MAVMFARSYVLQLSDNVKRKQEQMLRSITDDEYDKFYQSFREKVSEIDTQLSMLQEVEDNYYLSAKYLLELANRAYELFESSEVEERRQLIKLVLSNIRVENDLVRYDAIKPFDTILNYDHRLSLLLGKDSNL
jgi:hypothetical protein